MGKILAAAKLSEQNQITLPKEIRKKLGVKKHDRIVFVEENDIIYLVSKIDI